MNPTQDVAKDPAGLAQQSNPIPTSARSEHGERFYGQMKLAGKLIPLEQEPSIAEFAFWRIIDNRFPYDMIFKTHRMLLPIRVVAEYQDLNSDEVEELHKILQWMRENSDYDLVFENFPKRRSIHAHYHLHLASYHDDRSDFKL